MARASNTIKQTQNRPVVLSERPMLPNIPKPQKCNAEANSRRAEKRTPRLSRLLYSLEDLKEILRESIYRMHGEHAQFTATELLVSGHSRKVFQALYESVVLDHAGQIDWLPRLVQLQQDWNTHRQKTYACRRPILEFVHRLTNAAPNRMFEFARRIATDADTQHARETSNEDGVCLQTVGWSVCGEETDGCTQINLKRCGERLAAVLEQARVCWRIHANSTYDDPVMQTHFKNVCIDHAASHDSRLLALEQTLITLAALVAAADSTEHQRVCFKAADAHTHGDRQIELDPEDSPCRALLAYLWENSSRPALMRPVFRAMADAVALDVLDGRAALVAAVLCFCRENALVLDNSEPGGDPRHVVEERLEQSRYSPHALEDPAHVARHRVLDVRAYTDERQQEHEFSDELWSEIKARGLAQVFRAAWDDGEIAKSHGTRPPVRACCRQREECMSREEHTTVFFMPLYEHYRTRRNRCEAQSTETREPTQAWYEHIARDGSGLVRAKATARMACSCSDTAKSPDVLHATRERDRNNTGETRHRHVSCRPEARPTQCNPDSRSHGEKRKADTEARAGDAKRRKKTK